MSTFSFAVFLSAICHRCRRYYCCFIWNFYGKVTVHLNCLSCLFFDWKLRIWLDLLVKWKKKTHLVRIYFSICVFYRIEYKSSKKISRHYFWYVKINKPSMETLTRFRLTTNMKFIRQRSTPLTNPPHRYYIQKYISITLRHNVEISSDGDLIIFFFVLLIVVDLPITGVL